MGSPRRTAGHRPRIAARVIGVAALSGMLLSSPAQAARVSGLAALHHEGQTFLTWTSPPGAGWTFRVYRSPFAITSGSDIQPSAFVGQSDDSSWCDRRLYSLSGVAYGFCIDSLAAPLDPGHGLFVRTPDTAGLSYFAVTCQAPGGAEDTGIVAGENSLASPVTEVPDRPRPVYQRTLIGPLGDPADVYTLWTSDRETAFFPAMCNRPGEPYDCSLHRGLPGGPLMFQPHVRGGSFYLAQGSPPYPEEWQLMMDDFVRTWETNTFWFGYHESYDIKFYGEQSIPTTGVVSDYTARRVIFTLEWARRNFPVDTSRVYVTGGSMGGIAGVFLAMWRPDLVAAVMVNVPLFDFTFETDPNPLCQFNTGGGQRYACDRLWGEVGTNLRMEDGTPAYDRLNAGALAAGLESRFVPPLYAFSGRNDVTIGWAEKIPFYHAMNLHRAGGAFFWDTRAHGNTATGGAWWPVQNYHYVYRFRTDLSFPALSNCGADGDPGNGACADGDSIGTINGFLEWDPGIVDESNEWRVKLTLRDLPTLWGVVRAPESTTVDVTPRRLQRFVVSRQFRYPWRVTRTSDGVEIQSGVATPDDLGVLTLPAVQVLRLGSALRVSAVPLVGVDPEGPSPPDAAPRIRALPSPVRGGCPVTLEWPRAGERSVELFDLAGRRVRTLFHGPVEAGREVQRVDLGGVPAGIFVLRARQGSASAARRFVILP